MACTPNLKLTKATLSQPLNTKPPMTVANFVGLSEGSIKTAPKAKVYLTDGLKFHRVIPNFMIQGGCPLGALVPAIPATSSPTKLIPRWNIPDRYFKFMANAGPHQRFTVFITHVATPWLDGKHTVFGHVVDGRDVVNKIAGNDSIRKITILRKGKMLGPLMPQPYLILKWKDLRPNKLPNLKCKRHGW